MHVSLEPHCNLVEFDSSQVADLLCESNDMGKV
jgi:hypothetical protein